MRLREYLQARRQRKARKRHEVRGCPITGRVGAAALRVRADMKPLGRSHLR
jgi:hypothetical protein